MTRMTIEARQVRRIRRERRAFRQPGQDLQQMSRFVLRVTAWMDQWQAHIAEIRELAWQVKVEALEDQLAYGSEPDGRE